MPVDVGYLRGGCVVRIRLTRINERDHYFGGRVDGSIGEFGGYPVLVSRLLCPVPDRQHDLPCPPVSPV